jgi:predicted negative regulator of RcsB-dependent stress response
MILPLFLLAAAQTAPQAGPPDPVEQRFDRCVGLASEDPVKAEGEAGQWQRDGGGFLAHQCLGITYATELRWSAAAAEFEAAARGGEIAHDRRTANYWAQAGNAWLAAGEPMKARGALNAALASGTLEGLQRGEANLDRARAFVASGDLADARADLDRACVDAAADPLAWLLSATLARRMNDLPRAKKDITEALHRAGDDASVQLEAGNIAAATGDEAGAKLAWQRAVSIKPDGVPGRAARNALKQFDPPAQP